MERKDGKQAAYLRRSLFQPLPNRAELQRQGGSSTIISILSGTLTLYGTGINYGGPVEEAWGWPLVSVFVIIVGLGMAEIASKYPTAGGLYHRASGWPGRPGSGLRAGST